MTSIPENSEDKNSIYQRLRLHFCGTNERTIECCQHKKMEFDILMSSNNLTQTSGV